MKEYKVVHISFPHKSFSWADGLYMVYSDDGEEMKICKINRDGSLNLLDFRNTDYDNRIKLIAWNKLAKAVKLRDLEHNTKVTRLKGLRKKDFDRIEKYHRAYTYLLD